jgi:hypothetical protein
MTKKKYKIVHVFPPTFAVFNGQKYLFPGWIPVDDDVTHNDVEHINPYNSKIEEFKVEGSGGNTYTVIKRNNSLTCDCPGGKFRGVCKHITKMKIKLDLA